MRQHAIRQLRSLAADGCTRAEAAAELGWGFAKVTKWAMRHRVRFRIGGQPDPFLRSRVLDLIQKGHTTAAAVGRQMGRSRALVARWVRQLERGGLIRREGTRFTTRLEVTEKWA